MPTSADSTSAPPAGPVLPLPSELVGSDALLERFLAHVERLGLTLYPAQEEALLELFAGKHVLLNTPTGSGKSLVAESLCFLAASTGRTCFYTAPIKALVNEKFFALCRLFGPERVGMLTGDASINREAKVLCCTQEILSNLCLRDPTFDVGAVVMDEFHYYADPERGIAWQIPLLDLPHAQFLLMSATLGDTQEISDRLAERTGREVATVRGTLRPVPLAFEYRETPLHETIADMVGTGRAPVYLVNFTQRAAAEQAQNLLSVDFSSKEDKARIREALEGARFDSPYGKEMQRFLRHGVGLHHAGLLPKYRLLVEKLAQQGLLKVVSGTDTLGVGVNIPLRTVLFTQLCKFDGKKTSLLTAREFHQISGRAGRKGFDEEGFVVVQAPEHVIENLRLAQKQASGKKVVKKQPPTKGYVHWDRQTFERLVKKEPEPLESRFEVTHGMLLELLQNPPARRGGGYGRLVALVLESHLSDYLRRKQLKKAAECFRVLRSAELIHVVREWDVPVVRVREDLQKDFSLHHTLSLYLLAALPHLDASAETYALDVLSLVESILENPQVVLYKQLDALKTAKLAELKAQGVEYEQRMAELEKLEHPKPLRDFIYGTFDDFARIHPWVGTEDIRPKSVARDMLERFCGFDDYVREYGLQRSEGVLLRYLSQVYKTLLQNVPEGFRTEAMDDHLAQLRHLLRHVDSSLLDEWESLDGRAAPSRRTEVEPPRGPVALDANPRTFTASVRAELHALLRALAHRDYSQAASLVAEDETWTPERLEAELAPYWESYESIDLTPRARKPEHTFLKSVGPHAWEARQQIFSPDGEMDWVIECTIDASPRPASGADEADRWLHLRRIGT